jgi:hypothetical protein
MLVPDLRERRVIFSRNSQPLILPLGRLNGCFRGQGKFRLAFKRQASAAARLEECGYLARIAVDSRSFGLKLTKSGAQVCGNDSQPAESD